MHCLPTVAAVFLGLAWPATGLQAAEPPAKTYEVAVHRNLAYRTLEWGELLPLHNLADLYVPKDCPDYPVVILVHGGAWVLGDKTLDFIPDVARCLARQGVGVAAVNYRLSPLVKHPAHVQDLAKAVAWVRKHMAEYGGRPGPLFLLGHSAGGHLAALLACDERYLKREGLARKDIAGVIELSGVYQVAEATVKTVLGSVPTRVEVNVTANPYALAFGEGAAAPEASPLTHAQAGLPPFLVMYAEDELPTLPEMAERFAGALKKHQCRVELRRVPGRNHLTILWNARTADDPVVTAALAFVSRNRR